MSISYLHSVQLELNTMNNTTIPATAGHQTHALFLSLINQMNPALATRLHEEPKYRPFTVSSLRGVHAQEGKMVLRRGQTCSLRITLLDGGELWHCLSTRFTEGELPTIRLGAA